MQNKTPPHSIEAEKAVLGSILLNNDLIFEAIQKLEEECFYNTLNRKIFIVFKHYYDRGKNIDLLMVLDLLNRKQPDTKTENDVYTKSLLNFVCTDEHFKQYLEILLDYNKKRNLIDLGNEIINEVYANVDVEEIETKISNTITENLSSTEILSSSDISKFCIDVYDDKKEFLETGIGPIDHEFQGLNRSGLMTIAGNTGMGKTTLALNIAEYHVRNKKNVLIFELEMEVEDIVNKMISNHTQIPISTLERKFLNDVQRDKYFKELAEFSNFNLSICDKGLLSIEKMMAIIQCEHKKKKLDLVVIDYLQLIKANKGRTRAEEIGNITSSLKALARELKTHVILLSQLSREQFKQKREPILSDLKESSSIEQDSDVVLFTHYDGGINSNRILCAKNRHGKIFSVDITFDMPYSVFK